MLFKKMLSLTNPVHTMCQGREVTVCDVRKFVNSLVTVLSSQAFSDENALVSTRKLGQLQEILE